APGGGTIAYTGDAGRNAEGVAGLAFDALTRFHYDNLALVLNGDLGGDVITTIVFSGRNDAALNMGAVTPGGVPTFGGSDIPFRFNVRVTAPFRRLAETAAGLADATTIINRAQPVDLPPDMAPPQPEPIDPDALPPG
ncbi:MAG: YdbH domain-containing protein, partial [Hyphomonadaceae bacterium]